MTVKNAKKTVDSNQEIILDDLARGPNYFEVTIGGETHKFISLTAGKKDFKPDNEIYLKLCFLVEADSYPSDVEGYIFVIVDEKNRGFWILGWNWVDEIKRVCEQVVYRNRRIYKVNVRHMKEFEKIAAKTRKVVANPLFK